MFKELFNKTLTEAADANIQAIADIVLTTDFFGLVKVLNKKKFKATSMGYKAIKVEKGNKVYMITSEKNLEDPSEAEMVVDGIAIGYWK